MTFGIIINQRWNPMQVLNSAVGPQCVGAAMTSTTLFMDTRQEAELMIVRLQDAHNRDVERQVKEHGQVVRSIDVLKLYD